MLYRYFHLKRACLSVLLAPLQEAHGAAGSGSTADTFLASRGWKLQVDVAFRPHAMPETPEERHRATEEATRLLDSEFAAAAAGA